MRVQLNQPEDRRKFPTRLTELARTAFCLSLSLGMIVGPYSSSAFAAHKTKKDKKADHQIDFAETEKQTGLNDAAFRLINQGKWREAIISLEASTKASGSVNHESAWLAFGYVYMGQCDELKKLAAQTESVYDARKAAKLPPIDALPAKVETGAESTAQTKSEAAKDDKSSAVKTLTDKPAGEAQVCAAVIQAYDAMCHGKTADAEAILALLPDSSRNDAMIDFTYATLRGKEGKATEAMTYVQRSINEAPNFAWGYRTLGRLAQNAFKDVDAADADYVKALELEPTFDFVRQALIEIRVNRNDFDGAIQVETDALKREPNNADFHYQMAQVYAQQYRYNEALRQLEAAINIDPSVAKYYRSRATIKRNLSKLSRYKEDLNDAIADMQKAVDLSKDKPFELVELAAMNQEAGNTNRAADDLQQALKLDPDNSAAHERLVALLTREKRYDDLIAEWKRLSERKPKDPTVRLGYARALLTAGKTEDAIGQLKEAANLDTNNPEPHRLMGAIRYKQKDYHAAANEYTIALNKNPQSVPDLVALGYAYFHNDDYQQAEAAFVTALALQQLTQQNTPSNSTARLELMRALAELLLKEQRYSEAAAQMEAVYVSSKDTLNGPTDHLLLMESKALRDLTNVSAQALVSVYRELGPQQQSDWREALIDALLDANKPELANSLIEDAEKAESDNKDAKVRLRFASARALLQQGKPKQAQQLIADSIPTLAGAGATPEEIERSAHISNELLIASMVAAANNDFVQADTYARKSVEANPKNFRAYTQIGGMALNQGKPKDAIAWARKAIDVNQYAPQAYMVVGKGQAAAGDIKDASANFRRAAELYPGMIEAHRSLLETLRKLAKADEAKREEEQIAQMEKQK